MGCSQWSSDPYQVMARLPSDGRQTGFVCVTVYLCVTANNIPTRSLFFFFLDLTIQYLDIMKCYKFPFVYDAMIC